MSILIDSSKYAHVSLPTVQLLHSHLNPLMPNNELASKRPGRLTATFGETAAMLPCVAIAGRLQVPLTHGNKIHCHGFRVNLFTTYRVC